MSRLKPQHPRPHTVAELGAEDGRRTSAKTERGLVDTTPSWWPAAIEMPPQWRERFEALTGDCRTDRDGREVAYFVAKVRNQTGQGPTFAEVFQERFGDDGLHPAWPTNMSNTARAKVLALFRRDVAIQWRRAGWVTWEPGVPRSLKAGPAFWHRVKSRQARKAVR